MKWMLRIAVLLLVCAPLALAAPPIAPSSAQTTPSVTLTPNTGLVGGETVTVDGSGFPSLSSIAMCEGALTAEPTTSNCAGGAIIQADANGAFSVPFANTTVAVSGIARFIRPMTPFALLDCAQSVQCGILVQAFSGQDHGPWVVTPLNFAPQPPATFAINGSVTGPDGHALAGVAVWAYTLADGWVGSLQTLTDANGAYQIDIDPLANYVVRFGPPAGTDFVAQWFDNQPYRKSGAQLGFGLMDFFNDPVVTANAQLAAGGAISGVVSNGSGTGVSGVTVWAYGPGDTWVGSFGTTTAADGSYRIAGVRAANYKVRFMPSIASGLAIEWYDNAELRADAKSVTVTTGSTTSGIDDQLGPNS
jgi:Carboxypeptidase regulatory-like domain